MLLGRWFVHAHQPICLLAEVLLVETPLDEDLLLVALLAVEEEMVLAESVFLEKKERIPPELEIPEEEGELLLTVLNAHI